MLLFSSAGFVDLGSELQILTQFIERELSCEVLSLILPGVVHSGLL